MAQIDAKDDNPNAIRYNTLETLQFGAVTLAASQANTVIQALIPLPLAYKIQVVTAVIVGTVAGGCSINIVSGIAAEAGVGTPDNRLVGIVPPTVASAGQQLFAADQALTMTANLVQPFYPVNDLWDMIFPANTLLTLRAATAAATTGTLYVSVAACPVNIHYNLPDQTHPYAPSAAML